MKNNTILAIETSCDDTSISIIKNGKVLVTKDASSINEYPKYGGIIPEIASRKHEQYINHVYNECLSISKINPNEIDLIAYTAKPGLPGSLHVGKVFAKTLGFLLKKPLLPIDHMMGHSFSFAIDNPKLIKFPLISLVISGGNTIMYFFKSLTNYRVINETTDDAIGECLDKIGRKLGLDYPGGISLDKNFKQDKVTKTIPHLPPEHNFSFSGIKSFAINASNKEGADKTSIGSSSLEWCMEDILIKLKYYNKLYNPKTIAIGGGVAANQLLNNKINNLKDLDIKVTARKYCGDNAAMIGFFAYLLV